jgi:hypothetical protein
MVVSFDGVMVVVVGDVKVVTRWWGVSNWCCVGSKLECCWWMWQICDVVVRCWCGGIGSDAAGSGWHRVCLAFDDIWFSDRFQICWDLHVSLYLIGLLHLGVDCFRGGLWVETYLPIFSCYRCPINFWLAELLLGFRWADHFWFEIGS